METRVLTDSPLVVSRPYCWPIALLATKFTLRPYCWPIALLAAKSTPYPYCRLSALLATKSTQQLSVEAHHHVRSRLFSSPPALLATKST